MGRHVWAISNNVIDTLGGGIKTIHDDYTASYIQGMFKRPNFCYKDFIAHFTTFKQYALQSKSPLLAIHCSQHFFHCWNASWNALSVMVRSSLVAFSLISSMVWI